MDIKVIDLINSEFAVSPEDGDIIYIKLRNSIAEKEEVRLDFDRIDLLTTAFLNNAIGKLYREFTKEQLNKYIKIENISESDLFLLKKVIDRAKITFKDTSNITKAIEEELGDEQCN